MWTIGIQESATLVATGGCTIDHVTVLPELEAPYHVATLNASFVATCSTDQPVENLTAVWTVYAPESSRDVVPGRVVIATFVSCVAKHPSSVNINVNVDVNVDDASAGRHNVTLVRVNSGDAITVENPELWWPRGLGNQPLYTLGVALYRSGEQSEFDDGGDHDDPDSSSSSANGSRSHSSANSSANSSSAPFASAPPLDVANQTFGIRELKHVRNPGPANWTYIEEFNCGPRGEGGGFNCSFPQTLQDAGESVALSPTT
jgi:hypothetical protein